MRITRRKLMQSSAGLAASAALAQATENNARSWQRPPGARRPNIAIIILDDVGFSDFGCYGSEIDTPHIDRVAERGLRYTNFHVTALCAPTRACLMTGRNAHAVGVGNIAEWARPDAPGYQGYIRAGVRLLPEYLGDAGYSAFAVGKWHLSMLNDQDAMGPFDHWPTGRGFDHWYGFHGSFMDHFHPELFRDRSQVHPDKSAGYHLTDDLIDRSIDYIEDHTVSRPQEPFFLYLALGACHFPFHAPDEYLAKYRGRYDDGWSGFRETRFAKQQALGIAPESARLSPRGDHVPEWMSLDADERAFSARTQEAYAAMLDHSDAQIGRLVAHLEASGQLDDTLLLILSDNGAGKSRDPRGALDVRREAYIVPESRAEKIAGIDKVGTAQSQSNYGAGWGQLGNTPLKHHKGDTYEGGIRAPLVAHWPNGGIAAGGISRQYHHVTDLMPTLIELADGDITAPLDGTSMAYTFTDQIAATQKRIQHYETSGDRAIWQDGWKAVTLHQAGTPFDQDEWALYHAERDFSEILDLSARYPERTERLAALWYAEAERNDVLPMEEADLDALFEKAIPAPRPEYTFYPGATRLNRLSAPHLNRYDFDIAAHVTLGDEPASGILLASGDSMAGFELFMREGRLAFTYLYTRERRYDLVSDRALRAGAQVIGLRGRHLKGSGTQIELYADEAVLSRDTLPVMWDLKAANAGVRCGENRGAPISFDHPLPFAFDGGLEKVIVSLAL